MKFIHGYGIGDRQTTEAVATSVEVLPTDIKVVLAYKYNRRGYCSDRQVARDLRLPVSEVRQRLQRGLACLREWLGARPPTRKGRVCKELGVDAEDLLAGKFTLAQVQSLLLD